MFSTPSNDASLPIRKRYLKSHGGGSGEWFSGSDNNIDNGSSGGAGSGGYWPVGGSGGGCSSNTNNFSTALDQGGAGMSGTDVEARLRAGVIRHSSDPKRCLAYYYMNSSGAS